MSFPLEKSAIQSQETLSVSEAGARLESEEIEREDGWTEDLARRQRAKIDSQKVEKFKLRRSKGRYERKYKGAKKQVEELEHEIGRVLRAHKEISEKRNKRVQAMEDELTRAKELLAARSTELSAAQSFLSTRDGLSDAEVLDIVRVLNKNVSQVAANLTKEWKKLGSPPSGRFVVSKKNIDEVSRFCGPVLVHQSVEGDPAAVNLLVRSCICRIVTQITSSWRHDRGHTELGILGFVYEGLSASGRCTSRTVREIRLTRVQEEQATSARWRSLTHSHLGKPSSHDSTSIAQHLANVMWITGSFPSLRYSFDFVKARVSNGIETVERLARRLESAFMVDIVSSDTYLLFETPRTLFDETRMTKEFESPARRRRDKVAGTTEVGVWKSVGGRRTEVLLKPTVVLEWDVTGLDTESSPSCIFG